MTNEDNHIKFGDHGDPSKTTLVFYNMTRDEWRY